MVLKKKCPTCTKKIERKFNYCPWCSHSFRKEIEEEEFGMIGQTDVEQSGQNLENNLPFGLGGIVNGLMKQLERELSGMENNQPKKFKIKISAGNPQNIGVSYGNKNNNPDVQTISHDVSEDERLRRVNLERVEAKSNVRRLPEGIIYEIEAPGIGSVADVVITKLEESIELKAYARDKCFVKNIPLKFDILGYSVKNNKVFLRLRG